MTSWIYETPDGGKTVYRRPLGRHEVGAGKQVQVDQDVWFTMDQLIELGKQSYQQQCLRHEYPVLDQLWQEYHAMLSLVSKDGNEK